MGLTPALAGVGGCQQDVWQAVACVIKVLTRCRQVSTKCLASMSPMSDSLEVVEEGGGGGAQC